MESDLSNPGLWVAGSFLIAVIAVNVGWLAVRRRLPPPGMSAGGGWESLKALAWLVSALFLFLPPIAAWWSGALSPYFLGLTELDWIGAIITGGLLAAAIVALVVFGWLVYRHTLPERQGSPNRLQAWRAPLDAALLQWHWAFYRAGMIGWLALMASKGVETGPLQYLPPALLSQPLYWGSWLGMALVGVEWALNPFARRALSITKESTAPMSGAEQTMLRAVLAVATTALFILTRNFWLSLLSHVVVETAVTVFLPAPASRVPVE